MLKPFTYKASSTQDYYTFGKVMPGRSYTTESGYKYGFNGKEAAREVYGDGNLYDYGFRIYNPRLGIFLSVDPLNHKYPNFSPYCFAANSPITYIDIDGLGPTLPTTEINQYGEKQVWVSYEAVPGTLAGITVFTQIKHIPIGRPITENLSEAEIYRLAIARMFSPQQYKISDDQYLDEKYLQVEQDVKYYFSHLAITTMSDNPEMQEASAIIHMAVYNAIFSDDEETVASGISTIEKRTSTAGKINWTNTAETAIFMAPVLEKLCISWITSFSKEAILLKNGGIPKGFSMFADATKFKIIPETLAEREALKEAIAGNGSGNYKAIMGEGTSKTLGDKRLEGLRVAKYQYTKRIYDADGNVSKIINIHYLQNMDSGVKFDFKFKVE